MLGRQIFIQFLFFADLPLLRDRRGQKKTGCSMKLTRRENQISFVAAQIIAFSNQIEFIWARTSDRQILYKTQHSIHPPDGFLHYSTKVDRQHYQIEPSNLDPHNAFFRDPPY